MLLVFSYFITLEASHALLFGNLQYIYIVKKVVFEHNLKTIIIKKFILILEVFFNNLFIFFIFRSFKEAHDFFNKIK